MTDTKVLHLFPHPVLTKIDVPSFTTLAVLHTEINANAMSVATMRGNGALGHLGLTVPAAKYLLASNGVAFIPPANPGPDPVHPPLATQYVISEANRVHLAEEKAFNVFIGVEAALKKQLLEAVPLTYIKKLSSKSFGFATVTVLDILNHLDNQHGEITEDDLANNLKNMDREWNPSQPIFDLWNQIHECMEFAEDDEPIMEGMAVRSALTNLENTGVFTDSIRDWRKRPKIEWTIANLEKDFTLANEERMRLQTTRDSGYHAAAAIVTAAVVTPTDIPIAPPPAALAAAQPAPTSNNKNHLQYYCWSHGLGPNCKHTSATCRFPVAGHKTDSTANNMKGGCNTIHRRKGEVCEYVRPPPPAEPTY